MALAIREATLADLDQVAALTRSARDQLARWSPRWWGKATGADDIHPLWLRHVIEADGARFRVADDGSRVVGCAASMPQREQWFVDDIAVHEPGRWADVGVPLLQAIPERPALTCVPTADTPRQAASRDAGLLPVSSYWIRTTEQPTDTAGGGAAVQPLPASLEVPLGPSHTFGGPLDPSAPGALAFTDHDGGLVIGSPSLPAPPVYDPGGKVTVVDRVQGDPDRMLRMALDLTSARGDVLLVVVAGPDNHLLTSILADLGFERTVEVYAWPHP